MKKLTDEQIQKIEAWAKVKMQGYVDDYEKPLLKQIETYMKNGWKGIRISSSNKKEQLKRELELLKKEANYMDTVKINGVIVSNSSKEIYEWMGKEATCPNDVQKVLNEAKDVEVVINSPGGSVFDGSVIYTALKEHKGNVTVKIVGAACSIASVIAMAGDRVLMSPTSQLMIHNSTRRAEGDYRAMDSATKMLKGVNQSIANAYRIKSGKSEKEILEMMDKETWFTAQQALSHKLIDGIMFDTTDAKRELERLRNKVV